ncbi:helix-turn-helix domain-containing protein [Cyanobium sp. NIES-981]|uniref:helix-turn-helix domain-containing protein n=1 Tax=Cyanobium sp. NIES-981 TaxID=1851505 RepID=UPI0007DDF22F|nr:AraC family transcriptional regulator [Cyanobium sp. NIES-981]SBO43682.1 Transcriptional regulator, AraC family protein [Cyanobium sp. NIES-981]
MHGAIPFLDQQAVTLTQADAVVRRIADQLPLRGLVHVGPAAALRMRSVVVPLGRLCVAGTAHSPLRIEMDPLPDAVTLAFTEQGGADLRADGRCVRLTPRSTGMFLPVTAFQCESESIVSVLIHDSAQRLAATAAAMAGCADGEAPCLPSGFHRPVFLDGSEDPLRNAVFTSLRRTLRLLDQPLLLTGGFGALQLEDLLRRHLVLLLWPALADPDRPVPAPLSRDPIFEELLEWMDAHHDQPITLTQLAQRSGDSVRTLQYRFQRQVGCSPMQWLRQRRLEAARADIGRAGQEDSVAAIARRHGFHHLAGFSTAFQRRYGLLPSEARRQGRRR